MANKLGLTNEVKEIKLGKSLAKGENTCFHTFRYDFMPASVDATKRANVDIGDGHQVTVTVPHIEGSGTSNTVFKGSKKPYQKECVLIIDHATGEITLEKLSFNVQLKKTRAEGSSKIRPPSELSFVSKKSPSSSTQQKLSPPQQQQRAATFGRSSPVQKCSPLPRSPLTHPPLTMPELTATAQEPPVGAPEVGVLSSSSSSDSSSAESSDSSDSDHEGKAETPPPKPTTKGATNGFAESPQKKEKASSSFGMPSANSLPSMPKFNLLSEDLQLSESDSD